MSIGVIEWVLANSTQRGSAKLLLVVIASYCDRSGNDAYPGVEILADKIGTSVRGTQMLLHQLEQAGEIVVERNVGRGKLNGYSIPVQPERMKPASPFKGAEKMKPASPFEAKKGEETGKKRVKKRAGKGEEIRNPPTPPYKEIPIDPIGDPKDTVARATAHSGSNGNGKRNPVGEILALYAELFLARFGAKPVITKGKDPGIVQRLVASHGSSLVAQCLHAYFELDDPFVSNAGFSIGVFASRFNALLVTVRGEEKALADIYDPAADCPQLRPIYESIKAERLKREARAQNRN
jgi:hypothetical protein